MKQITFSVFLLIVCLIGMPAKAEDDFERILKVEVFVKEIVNRRLVYERGGTVIFLAEGRIGGNFSGSLVDGIWEWREDRVCHHLSIGNKKFKPDCRVPMIDGKKVKFIQENGHSYGIARIK